MDESPPGCPICRAEWAHGTIDACLGVSPRLQTYLYRCVACGTFWELLISHHAQPISAQAAADFLAEPDFEKW